jgi:hypothetical protein
MSSPIEIPSGPLSPSDIQPAAIGEASSSAEPQVSLDVGNSLSSAAENLSMDELLESFSPLPYPGPAVKFMIKEKNRENVAQVFTMTMHEDESISEYTTRFLKAVHDAHSCSTNDMLAERFLVSLTEPVQLCTKIAFQAKSAEEKSWSIQEISDTARNIMEITTVLTLLVHLLSTPQ